MGESKTISSAPLFKRIGEKKGAAAAFAKKINVSEQVVSNWKRRGAIPWAQHRRVADALGINPEEYLLEAGHVASPTAKMTAARAQVLEDFDHLPEWLQAHLGRKAREMRLYADALPAYFRDGMRPPPDDYDAYKAWENDLEADMRRRRGGSQREPLLRGRETPTPDPIPKSGRIRRTK